MAYLDNNGVLYFWQKIKTYVANAISGKVDAETGKGLSTNDYTTEEKTKLSNISAGAQVNVLEGIQKNGDTVTITNKIANISVPTKTSDLTNDSNFITLADVPDGAVASTTTPKMDGTANAGSETAFARGDHVHPSDSTKVDKVSGKGLSTNDYTTAEKNKLAGIESGAEENVIETISVNGSEQTVTDKAVDITVPTKVSDLTNDSGFLTSYTETDPTVPAWAKAANKPTYTAAEVGAYTKPSGGIPASDLADGVIPAVPSASTSAPIMDGTAAVGTSTDYARADHVHPSDTSKVDVSTFSTTVQSVQSAFGNYYTKTETDTAFGVFTTQLANKANKSDIASMYKYKGTVATVSDLPSSDQSVGDVYNVESTGMNYAWDGTAWDALGEIFTITAITNSEIDTICT